MWRTVVLLIALLALGCGPRGLDPAGERQVRPECPGCPELRLKLRDFAFVVDGQTYKDGRPMPPLPAGKLLIVADSEARQVHTVRVTGQGRDERTPVIGVGQRGYLLVDLAAGEYEIESEGDSRARGMWATMVTYPPGPLP